jgi:hypothetical protein
MLAIQNLEPGTRLKLTGDKLVEVVENPQDGTWLIVRALASDAPTELCHIDDILEIV